MNPSVLNLYSQSSWHEDSYLVASLETLENLRDRIEALLEAHKGLEGDQRSQPLSTNENFFSSDGEAFTFHLIALPEGSDCWPRLACPYADRADAAPSENSLQPYQVMLDSCFVTIPTHNPK